MIRPRQDHFKNKRKNPGGIPMHKIQIMDHPLIQHKIN